MTEPILIAVAVCLLAFLCINSLKVYRAVWLMFRGNYQSAVQCFDNLLQQDRLSKTIRGICVCNKANCQHRMGMLNESIVTLGQVDREKLDSNLRAAFDGLHGTNLLLLESELPMAQQYLESAYSQTKLSSYILPLGCCELLLGNLRKADELVTSFLNEANRRKNLAFGLRTTLLTDKAFSKCASEFLLGLYFMKKTDTKMARQHFAQATNCRVSNIYSEKARQLLRTTS